MSSSSALVILDFLFSTVSNVCFLVHNIKLVSFSPIYALVSHLTGHD